MDNVRLTISLSQDAKDRLIELAGSPRRVGQYITNIVENSIPVADADTMTYALTGAMSKITDLEDRVRKLEAK